MSQSVDFDTLVRSVLDGQDSTMRAETVRQLAFTTACYLARRGVSITLDGEPFEPGRLSLTRARRFMEQRGLFEDDRPDERTLLDVLANRFGDLTRLGPLDAVRRLQTSLSDPVLQVELQDSPRKARALAEWAKEIRGRDATVGKFRRSDRVLRLNLRGVLDGDVPVVVVVPFDERREAAAVEVIQRRIHGQHINEMVTRLVAIETAGEVSVPPKGTA